MATSAAKLRSAYQLQLSVLKGLGFPVEPGSTVLDFGCGAGLAIRYLQEQGFDAYGYDVQNKSESHTDQTDLIEGGILRINTDGNLPLPFPDDMFDIVLSYQVFEHVQNYEHSVAELARILKPGGVSLHVFPSRYRPLEAHNGVPFSPLLPYRRWLEFWIRLGFHRKRDSGKSWQKVLEWDDYFLKNRTNYIPGKEIRRHFSAHFRKVEFVQKEYLLRSDRLRGLEKAVRLTPLLPAMFGTFWTRVLLAAAPE